MSKSLINKMTGAAQNTDMNGSKMGTNGTKWCNQCKSWVYHNSDKCYALEENKQQHPQWYNNLMNHNGTKKRAKPRMMRKGVQTAQYKQ